MIRPGETEIEADCKITNFSSEVRFSKSNCVPPLFNIKGLKTTFRG